MPFVLVCPSDRVRPRAATLATLGSSNVSYFVNLEADDEDHPEHLLSGDRNLTNELGVAPPGLFLFSTNSLVGWAVTLHVRRGNIALSDGSVRQTTSESLREQIQREAIANRLVIP